MNLNLVIDTSQFKPFDYRMAWEAIDKYNTGYEKLQAVYDKIALTLGDLASAVEGSTRAKLIYDSYLQLFNTAASDFANGMNTRNARELSNLRKIYGTLIRLLERANEAMVKEAERRRAVGSEKNMLYLNIGTLDDWMDDPNRVLGNYSGTQLTNEVSAMASAVGKSIIARYNNGLLDNYTKLWLENKGLSRENVDKAVAEVLQGGIASVTDPIMKNILLSAMNSSGIYNWADENTKRAAENIAARGLYGGIGESQMGAYEDKAAIKQLEYDYAVKLAQKQADIEVDKAREIAKLTNPNPLDDGTGQTMPLHFSDKKVAGNVMKQRMAEATVDFMKANSDNTYVKKIKAYWDKHGGWKAAKEHWAANGFNGGIEWTGGTTKDKNFDKDYGIYYPLGNYLREHVTKNENLINIWRSPYSRPVKSPTFIPSPTGMFKLAKDNTSSDSKVRAKNWANFDDAAVHGYTFNGISQNDDPEKLSKYLSNNLKMLTTNEQIKLYDIDDISSDGTITYSKTPIKIEDMPTKEVSGSKVIDTSTISRTTLPDGSWLLTWTDAKGNPVLKVWRISDMPLEYQNDVATIKAKRDKLKLSDKYRDNKDALADIDRLTLLGIHQRGLDLYRLLDVEDDKR